MSRSRAGWRSRLWIAVWGLGDSILKKNVVTSDTRRRMSCFIHVIYCNLELYIRVNKASSYKQGHIFDWLFTPGIGLSKVMDVFSAYLCRPLSSASGLSVPWWPVVERGSQPHPSEPCSHRHDIVNLRFFYHPEYIWQIRSLMAFLYHEGRQNSLIEMPAKNWNETTETISKCQITVR